MTTNLNKVPKCIFKAKPHSSLMAADVIWTVTQRYFCLPHTNNNTIYWKQFPGVATCKTKYIPACLRKLHTFSTLWSGFCKATWQWAACSVFTSCLYFCSWYLSSAAAFACLISVVCFYFSFFLIIFSMICYLFQWFIYHRYLKLNVQSSALNSPLALFLSKSLQSHYLCCSLFVFI